MNIQQEQEIKIGDLVYNRHRQNPDINYKNNYTGKVVSIDKGVNPVYWVDCGNEFLSIMGSRDIKKVGYKK